MRRTIAIIASIAFAVGMSSSAFAATGSTAAPAKPAKPATTKPATTAPKPTTTASAAPKPIPAGAKACPTAPGQAKLCVDAKGTCHDANGKFAQMSVCTAPPATAAAGGKGVKCGNSYIAAGKTCHKP